MKNTLILVLLLFSYIQITSSQQINDKFPLGHYQNNRESYFFSIDFLDNGRMSFTSKNIHKDNNREFLFRTGTYTNENGIIRLKADSKDMPFHVFYRNDESLKKGKMRLSLNAPSFDAFENIVFAVGKSPKDKDFKNVSDYLESFGSLDNVKLPLALEIDAKPGDTLIFQDADYLYKRYFYYVIPKGTNDVFAEINTPSGYAKSFLLNWITITKGENENEMLLSAAGEEDNLVLYYTRPVNAAEIVKNNVPPVSKEGFTYLDISKALVVKTPDEVASDDEENTEVPVEKKKKLMNYYTTYAEVQALAQKTNKFMRLYLLPDSGKCQVSGDSFNTLLLDGDSQNSDFSKNFNEHYVVGILPGRETKNLSKYITDSVPSMIILSPEGVLLYKEYEDCDSPEAYFFFDEELSQSNEIYYSQLLLIYNKEVLIPRIQMSKNPDKLILKKYLDNVFTALACNSDYEYSLESLKNTVQYYSLSGNEDENIPYFPASKEVGLFLEMYADNQLKSRADTGVARTILYYYRFIYGKEDNSFNPEMPSSVTYLLKNLESFTKVKAGQTNFADANLMLDHILAVLSTGIQETNLEDGSASALLAKYKKATELAPLFKDIFVMDYFARCQYYKSESQTLFIPEEIAFVAEYFKPILKETDINKYFSKWSEKFMNLMPGSFNPGDWVNYYSYWMYLAGENKEEIAAKAVQTIAMMLNNYAWNVYLHKADDQYIADALKWAESAIAFSSPGSRHTYLDTYAHLLYRAGNKEEAVIQQGKALEFAKANEEKGSLLLREIRVEYQLMKLGMLGQEE